MFKNAYLLCIATALLNFFCIECMEPDLQSRHIKRLKTFGQNLAIGTVASAADITVNQPFFYIKNMLQQDKKFFEIPLHDPRILYRGSCINFIRLAPTSAVQISVNELLRDLIPGERFSVASARAFTAGISCTLIGAPLEVIILHMQNKNLRPAASMQDLIREGGYRCFMRGIVPKMMRGGGFGIGFLAIYPEAEKLLYTATDNRACATLGAGAIGGATIAAATHPFDTVATRMQADYKGVHLRTLRQAFSTIYNAAGVGGFYQGVIPRAFLVASAITIMNTVKSTLSPEVISFS